MPDRQVHARGEAQHHVAVGLADGAGERLDLLGQVGGDHVVGLDVVHAPGGELPRERVVVGAPARVGVVDAPVVVDPGGDVLAVGDLRRGVLAAPHGRVGRDGLAGDAAQDVEAELQAQGVHVVGQGLEARSAGRGGEAVRGRLGDAVPVEAEVGARVVPARPRGRVVPLDVDDDVLPAEVGHVLGDELRIGPRLGLGDRGAERVPGVPAHRGRGGDSGHGNLLEDGVPVRYSGRPTPHHHRLGSAYGSRSPHPDTVSMRGAGVR